MKRFLIILALLVTSFYALAADHDELCTPEQVFEILSSRQIEKWGSDYQSCKIYEWELHFPEEWTAVEFEYTIDLNPLEHTDALEIYIRGEDGIMHEQLNYAFQPTIGKFTIPLYDPKSAYIKFISQFGNAGELYRGFKLSYREVSSAATNQVFYSNVGIGIQPQERLHVNGPIRGDGESGSLRIRTTEGTTEIGAADSIYSHFYTDRSAYFFNKPIYIAGGTIGAYGNPKTLHFQTNNIDRLTINSDGTIDLMGETYLYNALYANGAIWGGDKYNKAVRIQSTYGYGDIGAVNSGYFHFYTDRPGFYFNTALTVNGGRFRSASGSNLYLNTFDQTRMTILQSNGNVGIGILNPMTRLHINDGALKIGLSTSASERAKNILQFGDSTYVQIGEWEKDDYLSFKASGYNFTKGNVGVGKLTPTCKLDVAGTMRAESIIADGLIRAEEIIVETTGADFVFAEDYQLRPLSEVKAFIEENKHLPEIKSAQEMQENGVSVNELQTQLLQKIEELTLYLIQQEQTIQELSQELEQLKK